MQRFAAVALVIVGLVLPALGQRGGGHSGAFGGGHGFGGGAAGAFHGGGFAGPHLSGGFSAPRFSGGFAPRVSRAFSSPRSYGYGSARFQTRFYGSSPISPRSRYGYRSGYAMGANHSTAYHHGTGYHHHGGGGFHWSITSVPTVATLVPGWFGLGPYGYYPYGDGFGWNDSSWSSDDPPGAAAQGYDPGPEEQQPAYRPAYEPTAAAPAPTAVPDNQSATTIVLNDGRSVQIRNYALTPTTLYVLDAQRQNIPLNQINIAATQQANSSAGIEFQVPKIVQ